MIICRKAPNYDPTLIGCRSSLWLTKCSRRSRLATTGVFDQDCHKIHVGVTLTWLYPEDCSYWAVVCSAASDVWRCRPLQMKSLLEKKPLPAELLYRVDWHMMSVLSHRWSGLLFDVTIPCVRCVLPSKERCWVTPDNVYSKSPKWAQLM